MVEWGWRAQQTVAHQVRVQEHHTVSRPTNPPQQIMNKETMDTNNQINNQNLFRVCVSLFV